MVEVANLRVQDDGSISHEEPGAGFRIVPKKPLNEDDIRQRMKELGLPSYARLEIPILDPYGYKDFGDILIGFGQSLKALATQHELSVEARIISAQTTAFITNQRLAEHSIYGKRGRQRRRVK